MSVDRAYPRSDDRIAYGTGSERAMKRFLSNYKYRNLAGKTPKADRWSAPSRHRRGYLLSKGNLLDATDSLPWRKDR